MGKKFEDIDFEERRHRDAIIARWAHSYDRIGGLTPERARHLTRHFDDRMRSDHDSFLDALVSSDIGWLSPRIENMRSDELLDEIVQAIRTNRQSAHPTDRMGRIETSSGPLAWAVKKPDSWGDLFHSVRSGQMVSVYIWHPDDLAIERLSGTSRSR